MEKKGISAVVATVLIILITVASVSLVWFAVMPMIRDQLDFSALESRIDIVTSGGYTFYDAVEGKACVQVRRGMDDVDIERIRIIFYILGESFSSLVEAPEIGSTRTYVFDMEDYGVPDRVSVSPVFIVGSGEKDGPAMSNAEAREGELGFYPDFIYQLDEEYENDIEYYPKSCSDLFVMGNFVDGDYLIDPDGYGVGWDPYVVNCEMSSGGLEVWGLDAESGDTEGWLSGSLVAVQNSDVYDGVYSFVTTGESFPRSEDIIPIDVDKNYSIEGWFKSDGSIDSRLYFGFIPYDKNGRFITHISVAIRVGSETTLYNDCAAGDKIVNITDGAGWGVWQYNAIAFEIDDSGSYNDLPNYNLSKYNITRVENMGSHWEVEFNTNVGKSYSAGTKIREHYSGGTYMYSAAGSSYPPNDEWKKYAANVSGEVLFGNSGSKWRRGTKYARFMLLANYRQTTDAKLLYDNIRVVVT